MSHIHFQGLPPHKGAYTSNQFEDTAKFLCSFASGSSFTVYENQETTSDSSIKLRKVLKKIKIESIEPANKGAGSKYLGFTAKDAADESITYRGIINF